jgi:hypothetical protein
MQNCSFSSGKNLVAYVLPPSLWNPAQTQSVSMTQSIRNRLGKWRKDHVGWDASHFTLPGDGWKRYKHPQQQLGQKERKLLDDGDLAISAWTRPCHSTATSHRIALLSNVAISTQPYRSTGALDCLRGVLATGSISAAWGLARHAFFWCVTHTANDRSAPCCHDRRQSDYQSWARS